MLLLLLVVSFLVVYLFGASFSSGLPAMVLAYLMQGFVAQLVKWRLPEWGAVLIVYTFFLGALGAFVAIVLPLIWGQLVNLFNDQLPELLNRGHALLQKLPEQYPNLITVFETDLWLMRIKQSVTEMGEQVLSFSFSKLPNLMGVLIFLSWSRCWSSFL